MEITAHWILTLTKVKDNRYCGGRFYCSNCEHFSFDSKYFPPQECYCHSCGAHMIEEPVIEIEELDESDLVLGGYLYGEYN